MIAQIRPTKWQGLHYPSICCKCSILKLWSRSCIFILMLCNYSPEELGWFLSAWRKYFFLNILASFASLYFYIINKQKTWNCFFWMWPMMMTILHRHKHVKIFFILFQSPIRKTVQKWIGENQSSQVRIESNLLLIV